MEPKIIISRIRKLNNPNGRTKGFCTATINGIEIRNVRIVDGKNGLFASLPQEKGKDGNYYNTVRIENKDVHQACTKAILEGFNSLK